MRLQKLEKLHAYEIEFSNSRFRFRSPIQQLNFYPFPSCRLIFRFGKYAKYINGSFCKAWEITILGFTFGSSSN